MYTYSVTLMPWSHASVKTKNNESKNFMYPVYIRISINTGSGMKTRYIATNHKTSLAHWDEKKEMVKSGHPLSSIINPEISTQKNEVTDFINVGYVTKKFYTAEQVKEYLTFGKSLTNVFTFFEEYKKTPKCLRKSPGTIENYNRHFKVLKNFVIQKKKFKGENPELYFEEVNVKFLEELEQWINDNTKKYKPDSRNYTWKLMSTYKTIFNAAEKAKIIIENAFVDYDMPPYEAPGKNVLTLEEMMLWKEYIPSITNPQKQLAAIYFYFSCWSGLRISDWIKFDPEIHVVDNMIRLRPEKTKKHNKWVEMPISQQLAETLVLIKNKPFNQPPSTIHDYLKRIAKSLKIEKTITPHVGRHTFAVTVCLNNRVTSEAAAKLMGINLQTFIRNYSRVSRRKINEETVDAWNIVEKKIAQIIATTAEPTETVAA